MKKKIDTYLAVHIKHVYIFVCFFSEILET